MGFMVDDDARTVTCQFRIDGRIVSIPVSVADYEKAWLAANKCGPRTKRADHEARAAKQAEIAVWAILADLIKAQCAMIAGGLRDVDTAFLPDIQGGDGRRLIEVAKSSGAFLPPPQP